MEAEGGVDGGGRLDRAELHQPPDRVFVQGVLAGRVVEGHSVAVPQWAGAGQHARGRRCLLRGQEVVVGIGHVVATEGQHVCVTAQAGRGSRGCGLGQGQRGTCRAQRGPAWQRGLVAHDDGLALQQGRGGSLQNEFGALNALVLVTLKVGGGSGVRVCKTRTGVRRTKGREGGGQ